MGRALKTLGVDHIAAYSPEARGRSERMFGPLQNRLVNELRLAGITDRGAANRYLQDTYGRLRRPPPNPQANNTIGHIMC